MKNKISRKSKIYVGVAILMLLLNILAWGSRVFCDTYIAYIFPVWLNTYGRLTGLFPFSVGECLLVAGILLVLAAAAFGMAEGVRRLMGLCIPRLRGLAALRWRQFLRGFYAFFAWTLLGVGVIMTLNCIVLYHASTFSEKYYGGDTGEYSLTELLRVYNLVAVRCNELSTQVERDGEGWILYPGSTSSKGEEIDMEDKAIECMQQLGGMYPQLDGFYPRPKALFFSDFMCQQYMQGWYFPFSLEANYNDVMYIMRKPATMCHELAHLRGYIYEDEANFISYLACTQSDDVYFQYSGYLSVLNYLINDINKAADEEEEALRAAIKEAGGIQPLSSQVAVDNTYVTEEEWERINRKALLDTEMVDEATDAFLEANLRANGVADGRISYSRVVRLLLQYYRLQKS